MLVNVSKKTVIYNLFYVFQTYLILTEIDYFTVWYVTGEFRLTE